MSAGDTLEGLEDGPQDDGDDLDPEQIADAAAEIEGEAPEAGGGGEAHATRPATGPDPQAVEELKGPIKIADALIRSATGASVPDDLELDVEDADARARMAARMLAPAYQRIGGAGTLDWRVQAALGVGLIVVPAVLEGKLSALGGSSDDGDDEDEGPNLPAGVRRPTDASGNDSSEDSPEAHMAATEGGSPTQAEVETPRGVKMTRGG